MEQSMTRKINENLQPFIIIIILDKRICNLKLSYLSLRIRSYLSFSPLSHANSRSEMHTETTRAEVARAKPAILEASTHFWAKSLISA